MAKSKAFPKKLYVKAEFDGSDTYFVANEDVINCTDVGDKVKVGIYELKEIIFAEGTVKLSPAKG